MLTVLVMGLADAGKSTFAARLAQHLNEFCNVTWLSADAVRAEYNDWDFSPDGRKRQAYRMKGMAHKAHADGSDVVILDFICPTPEYREIVDPSHVVFLDTRSKSIHEDTNAVFVPPTKAELGNRVLLVVKNFAEATTVVTDLSNALADRLHKGSIARTLHRDSRLRSILKSVCYGLLGAICTFAISYAFTHDKYVALSIASVDAALRLALYFFHERVWVRI